MKCDCNPYSEKILIKRGWKFLSENIKKNQVIINIFNNKWYEFEKIESLEYFMSRSIEQSITVE